MGSSSIDRVHEVAASLIEHFGMEPLPVEGTYFASTYRSGADERRPAVPPAPRSSASTATTRRAARSSTGSRTTRYGTSTAGDPIRLVLLLPDGGSDDVILGERRPRGPATSSS